MTLEQVQKQCEINLDFYNKQKKVLWMDKEQKLAGSKTAWKEANITFSAKISLLEEILHFINNSK
jgi:hypothetical protein